MHDQMIRCAITEDDSERDVDQIFIEVETRDDVTVKREGREKGYCYYILRHHTLLVIIHIWYSPSWDGVK